MCPSQTLFGLSNPSARLTISFPTSNNDTWLSPPGGGPVNPESYPGVVQVRSMMEKGYVWSLSQRETSLPRLSPAMTSAQPSTRKVSMLDIAGMTRRCAEAVSHVISATGFALACAAHALITRRTRPLSFRLDTASPTPTSPTPTSLLRGPCPPALAPSLRFL